LIADIWSSITLADYMGVSAKLTYGLRNSETVVVGFMRMIRNDRGSINHSAEMVKETIELILNNYNFDKKKIIGMYIKYFMKKLHKLKMLFKTQILISLAMVTDQGSNFVKCFKNNLNTPTDIEEDNIEDDIEVNEDNTEANVDNKEANVDNDILKDLQNQTKTIKYMSNIISLKSLKKLIDILF